MTWKMPEWLFGSGKQRVAPAAITGTIQGVTPRKMRVKRFWQAKTPTTATDRIALTNAALKRETRSFKRLAWALESNAGQRCERSRVRMTGKIADLVAARLTVQA